MGLYQIKPEIQRFISSGEPEVLCIQGKWGVGKTYAWNVLLEAAKKSQNIGLDSYSYVSLFGLSSIDEVKRQVFENTVPIARIGKGPTPETLKQMYEDRLRTWKPAIDIVAAMFRRGQAADAVYQAAFLGVRNQLICFDDFERAGGQLDELSVLGLASQLRWERDCKIVFLLNDEKISKEDLFRENIEKVADLTLQFTLTSDEAFEIALAEAAPTTSYLKDPIRALGITNIRIIKQVERLFGQFLELGSNFEDGLNQQAAGTLTLGVWLEREPTVAPDRAYLKKYNSFAALKNDEKSDQEKGWDSGLIKLGFHGYDEFSEALLDAAHAGYFDKDTLLPIATKRNAEFIGEERTPHFRKAWEEIYWGKLVVDEDAFLANLLESAKNELAFLSVRDMSALVRQVRQLSDSTTAGEIVEKYVAQVNWKHAEFRNYAPAQYFAGESLDKQLLERLEAGRKEWISSLPLEGILDQLAADQGIGQPELDRLSAVGVDELIEWLESKQGPDFSQLIRRLTTYREMEQPLRKALTKVSKNQPLTQMKFKNFIESED